MSDERPAMEPACAEGDDSLHRWKIGADSCLCGAVQTASASEASDVELMNDEYLDHIERGAAAQITGGEPILDLVAEVRRLRADAAIVAAARAWGAARQRTIDANYDVEDAYGDHLGSAAQMAAVGAHAAASDALDDAEDVLAAALGQDRRQAVSAACECPDFWSDDLCIDGTIYSYCAEPSCGGACEPTGRCPCPLHETVGDHEVPDGPRPQTEGKEQP